MSSGGRTLTYLDLFRFRSLRKVSVFTSLAFFSTSIAYFVPNYKVDQFGFDFYFNGVFIFGTELVVAPIALCLIQRLERRKFLIACSIVSLICSLVMIPLDKSYICTHNCWITRFDAEMIVFFILRFFSSFSFITMYIYCLELFPTQVSMLAFNFLGIMLEIPSLFVP